MAIDFKVQLETLSEYCKELDIISARTIAEVLKNPIVRNHPLTSRKPSCWQN